MDKKEFIKAFIAGVFFIAGIVLIMTFILTIGKSKGFAQPKFQVEVLFKNVGGLIEGAPTRLSGVTVGSVADIEFLDSAIKGRGVKVVLNIWDKFRGQLDKNVRFSIKTEGILGEKLIEITVLETGKKIDLSKPIFGEDPIDVQDLTTVFTEAARSFTNTSDELSQIDMVEMSEIMTESSQALLISAKGFNSITEELKDITLKSKRLLDRIEQKVIEGSLFKVF